MSCTKSTAFAEPSKDNALHHPAKGILQITAGILFIIMMPCMLTIPCIARQSWMLTIPGIARPDFIEKETIGTTGSNELFHRPTPLLKTYHGSSIRGMWLLELTYWATLFESRTYTNYTNDDVIWLRNHAYTWMLVPNIGCKQTMASNTGGPLTFLVFTHFFFLITPRQYKQEKFLSIQTTLLKEILRLPMAE